MIDCANCGKPAPDDLNKDMSTILCPTCEHVAALEQQVINEQAPADIYQYSGDDTTVWCGTWRGGYSIVWTDGINYWCEWFPTLPVAFMFLAALFACRDTEWCRGMGSITDFPQMAQQFLDEVMI